MDKTNAVLLLAYAACCSVAAEPGHPNVSSDLDKHIAVEIVPTRVQAVQLQLDERLASLASTLVDLMQSVSQLAEVAQPVVGEWRGSNYKSCSDVPRNGSGVYQIQPEKPFKGSMSVLCDHEYDSGGWTVIQHRFDGSVNFYRGWQEYKNGFGNLDGEFWLGLERIHQLTASRHYELVVLLEDFEGNKTYARYDRFEIGDESVKYLARAVDGYSGTAGNGMGRMRRMKFTTLDSDNDTWDNNCAVAYKGAWWYFDCLHSNLNGRYLRGATNMFAEGMVWAEFRGLNYALKKSKMMIRPKVSKPSKPAPAPAPPTTRAPTPAPAPATTRAPATG